VSQAKKLEAATLAGVMQERNRVLRCCMAIRQQAQNAVENKVVAGIAEQRAGEAKLAVAVATLAKVVEHVQGGTDYKVVKNNSDETLGEAGGS